MAGLIRAVRNAGTHAATMATTHQAHQSLRHRSDVGDWDCWIHSPNRSLHGHDFATRVFRKPDLEIRHGTGKLRERSVNPREVFVSQAPLFDGRDDAHDLHCVGAERETPVQRIPVSEEAMCHELIDERDLLSSAIVGCTKATATQHPDAHGAEILRCHVDRPRDEHVTPGRSRITNDGKPQRCRFSLWDPVAGTGRNDSRKDA